MPRRAARQSLGPRSGGVARGGSYRDVAAQGGCLDRSGVKRLDRARDPAARIPGAKLAVGVAAPAVNVVVGADRARVLATRRSRSVGASTRYSLRRREHARYAIAKFARMAVAPALPLSGHNQHARRQHLAELEFGPCRVQPRRRWFGVVYAEAPIHAVAAGRLPEEKRLISADTKWDARCSAALPIEESVTIAIFLITR